MNLKLAYTVLPFLIIAVAFLALQIYVTVSLKNKKNLGCGGDWNYQNKCPIGSYCKSLGQGDFAGGMCTPFFRIMN